MSLNLHCQQLDLWQTPTYITHMCYSNGDGGWVGIKYRYVQWVRAQANGVYITAKEQEDLKYLQERIAEHLKELDRHKKLDFFVM